MKYVVVLGDGMADEPIQALGGLTPLEYAKTPVLDRLAPCSMLGLAATIPKGMQPGSDTANLSVLGYDPRRYYTGRSPLEALSIGVDLKPGDIAIRCNLVTLSEGDCPYGERTILDHSAGEISTGEAGKLLEVARQAFASEEYHFYQGTSYRHLLVWSQGQVPLLTPPHDILGQKIEGYLPKDPALKRMMEQSHDLLNRHPVNERRMEEGKNKANSIWFWGGGTKPSLPSFEEKTGKKGVMVSAVDLLKGIAQGTGMRNIHVPGATGGLDTNYEGKARLAAKALLEEGADFAYIHVEAPDEMGHQGSAKRKVEAIERLDQRLIGVLAELLEESGEDFRLLVMPDHPTPVRCRTHVCDPVPFLLYDSRKREGKGLLYSEKNGKEGGIFIRKGYQVMDLLLED